MDRELAMGTVRKGARTGSLEAQMWRIVPFPGFYWLLCPASGWPLEAVAVLPQHKVMGLSEKCLPSIDKFNIWKK